ncbi:MAG: tetratricopeptide repeat protein [Candidatus Eisenbacteria bacterium]|nr:tetratricopeptide repeat protein [Candidatus Eisenbacteria bacterium]
MIGRREIVLFVITGAVSLLFCLPSYAQQSLVTAEIGAEEATEFFRQANMLYAQGGYEEAADLYQRIVAGGFRNADVYYNLANARYKSGEIAQAVLGYERALRLDPSHADARANLAFVSEQLPDRQAAAVDALPPGLERAVRRADTRTLAVLASALYFLLVGCIIVGIVRRVFQPWLTRTIVVLIVAAALSGAGLGLRIYGEATEHGAIVVASDVAARTGPGEDFVLEFRLHEGTKVRMMETRGDWARVSVGGTDLEGWVPSAAVEAI